VPAGAEKEGDEKAVVEHRQRTLKAIYFSSFLSVLQHTIVLQSEPLLLKQLLKGDTVASARALANSQGLVGVIALVFNQFGGKLTDAIGRKPGFLLGPLGNIILGLLVCMKPSKSLLIACRVLRMIITTFSNTVVAGAAMADILPGPELAAAGAKVGAVVGAAITLSPILEAKILTKMKNPKYTFLAISAFAAMQAFVVGFILPETLPKEKRKEVGEVATLDSLNPFGFTKLYTKGSKSLQKLVNVCTFQYMMEGKNVSDFAAQWWFNQMKWGVLDVRNYVTIYGLSCVLSGMFLIPKMAKEMTVRAFTSVGNASNVVNFAMKSFTAPSSGVYYLVSFLGLPGVNASSGTLVRAITVRKAAGEGFGRGEFSAYSNNLRAIPSALGPMLYGYVYAGFQDSFPGLAYLVAAIFGGIIPEVLMRSLSDDELTCTQ